MSGPLIEMGFRSMAATITRLKKRNAELNLEVFRLRTSRDEWKRKAVSRGREIRNLEAQVRRWKARAPEWRVPPQKRPKPPTPEQLEQHRRIVRRIRSIPIRDRVVP